jgi:hypothetical protein
MTLADWQTYIEADITRRQLPELLPVLQPLVRATASLRTAPWNADASEAQTADATADDH